MTKRPAGLTLLRNALPRILAILGSALLLTGAPAKAATCGPATSAGAATSGWDTYCWLDMSTYDDATARSPSGQFLSYTLTDGSVFSTTVKTTSTAATGVVPTATPAWTGAAIGNTSFLGIPGKPILYGANNASTVTITFSGMSITPPAGATAGAFMFIAADGESSNGAESLTYVTNGSDWRLLDLVPPISGTTFPTYNISGTTATVTGVAGTVGGQIFGSVSPTTVATTLVNGGLQGVMFAVRFASVRLNKNIQSSRLAAADQFTYSIKSTTSGAVLSSHSSTGTGNGPFTSAAASLASGISVTITEAMAGGSTSTLGQYNAKLSCTNSNVGSPTTMPTNVTTTSYVLGSVAFGDAINCTFVNTPVARLALTKALSTTRLLPNDQFTVQIKQGATVTASATTTGVGSTVATGTTGVVQVVPATTYTVTEVAAGTTNPSFYTGTMACTNAYGGSTTTLPTTVGGTVTVQYGDDISCTLTNSPSTNQVILSFAKTSSVFSDPQNGTVNPKAIPGAVMQYALSVTNSGPGLTTNNSIVLTDPLPANVIASVASGSVVFTDGTPSSGLTFVPANVSWSNQAGGGAPYTYTPVPDVNGYDQLVTGIRIAPGGTMAAATLTSQPSFVVTFKAKVK